MKEERREMRWKREGEIREEYRRKILKENKGGRNGRRRGGRYRRRRREQKMGEEGEEMEEMEGGGERKRWEDERIEEMGGWDGRRDGRGRGKKRWEEERG